MSHSGLKSPRPAPLPVEENDKCRAVKYCVEFLSIGNHFKISHHIWHLQGTCGNLSINY